jgi:hypothetical protein
MAWPGSATTTRSWSSRPLERAGPDPEGARLRTETDPAQCGTKSCAHDRYVVPARGSVTVRMRLTPDVLDRPLRDVEAVLRQCRAEAGDFCATIHPPAGSDDERLVQRQTFGGLLKTKQIYLFDVSQWLEGEAVHRPLPESRRFVRNNQRWHLNTRSHPRSRVLPAQSREGLGAAPDQLDRARGVTHQRMGSARRWFSNQWMDHIPMLYSGRLPRRPSILTSIPARVAMTPCTRPTR